MTTGHQPFIVIKFYTSVACLYILESVVDYYRSMRRSYKFLLRPTSKQSAALEACLEDTRQLYNAALEERQRQGHTQRDCPAVATGAG